MPLCYDSSDNTRLTHWLIKIIFWLVVFLFSIKMFSFQRRHPGLLVHLLPHFPFSDLFPSTMTVFRRKQRPLVLTILQNVLYTAGGYPCRDVHNTEIQGDDAYVSNSCESCKILTAFTSCHPNRVALWAVRRMLGKSITGDAAK